MRELEVRMYTTKCRYLQQAQFAASNRQMVGVNLRASYNEISASLWLSIRLQVGNKLQPQVFTAIFANKLLPF